MQWTKTKLGDFAPFLYGKGLPQAKRKRGEVPVYGSNGIVGTHSEAFVAEPAVIIGRKGSVGEVHLANGPSWPIDTAFYALGSKEVDLHFLYYLLKSLPITSNSDSAVPGLNREFAHSLEICVPDIQGQNAIGKILFSLDQKIELNNALSKTLEDMAQTIFKSWFVDFDPVKAKMAGEKPAGMDAATAALFPDTMEESELGLIPKGWEVRKIESLCETMLGGTPSRSRDEFWGGEIPWINSGKVNDFRITTASEYITELGLEKSATKLLPKGTTVLAITGATLGQFSRLEFATCANQSVVGIVGSAEASNEFMYLNIKNGIQRLISAQTGGAQQHINKEDVNAFLIVFPGKKLMNFFTDIVEGIFAEIGVLLSQSISLAEIRDSLLPRLISGELQIPEEMLAS
jgi:type I restriction enzyme, S subunit